MRVYRIETESGKGICAATGSDLCSIYNRIAGDETEHCGFSNSCWIRIALAEKLEHKKTCFAFPSLKALRNWFPQAIGRKAMQQNGAKLKVYEVKKVIAQTPFQCVFDKEQAVLLETLDLYSLNSI